MDVVIHEQPRSKPNKIKKRHKPLRNPFWKSPKEKSLPVSKKAPDSTFPLYKTVRPHRQFDVSTVKGLGDKENPSLQNNGNETEAENKNALYYPQSSEWKLDELTSKEPSTNINRLNN